jgi:hypothetical protein
MVLILAVGVLAAVVAMMRATTYCPRGVPPRPAVAVPPPAVPVTTIVTIIPEPPRPPLVEPPPRAVPPRVAPKPPAKPERPNLLRNGSFEDRLRYWTSPPGTTWAPGRGTDETGALAIHAARPPDDGYIHETIVQQCVALGTATRFTIEASAQLQGMPGEPHANRVNVLWYDDTACKTRGQWGAYLEPRSIDGWQTMTAHRLVPSLGATAALITIVQNGRYSRGRPAIWDDVVFIPADDEPGPDAGAHPARPSAAALVNGALDTGLDGWDHGGQVTWAADQGAGAPGAAKVSLESRGENYGGPGFSQCVALGDHRRFELGAQYLRDVHSTTEGGARLRLAWFGDPGCTGGSRIDDHATPSDAADWQKLRITDLIAPDTARSARIEIIQSIRGRGVSSAYWDDIYFKPVD